MASGELPLGWSLPFGSFRVDKPGPDELGGRPIVEHTADLVIIGGGYMAINALEAAAYHLPKGAKVVVVAKEGEWGGNWTTQYEFVRLHQPFRGFTAGARAWSLDRPADYLARRKEILTHFDEIAEACVAEKELRLLKLFEYNYVSHLPTDGGVEVYAEPCNEEADLPVAKLSAGRVIFANGGSNVGVRALTPKTLKTNKVHSLAPVDIMTPEWNTKMHFAPDAPIWVLGSGKTAIDVIKVLARSTIPNVASRIRCVAGGGTWFMNRELFRVEDGQKSRTVETTVKMIHLFEGTNGAECCRELAKTGFMHSPIPGATSFLAGICSPDEIETVQKALSPASERIVRAYFSNVVERPGGELEMQLREIEGGRTFTRPIEPGSFVVNCTGHLAAVANPKVAKLLYSEAAPIVPVLSAAGRVFNCPSLPGFSGPNGNLGTHMFYRGLLTEAWLRENCVRVVTPTVVSTDKARYGIELWMHVQIMHSLQYSTLPPEIQAICMTDPTGSPYGLVDMLEHPDYPDLLAKCKRLSPARATDTKNPRSVPLSMKAHL